MAKILLVEDNEMNRDMLARRLQRRGYEMLVAVDGAAGVSMAQQETPDLILMALPLVSFAAGRGSYDSCSAFHRKWPKVVNLAAFLTLPLEPAFTLPLLSHAVAS
jgi:CheY-like chemotaxis protein